MIVPFQIRYFVDAAERQDVKRGKDSKQERERNDRREDLWYKKKHKKMKLQINLSEKEKEENHLVIET